MEIKFYNGDKVKHASNIPHKASGSVGCQSQDRIFVHWLDGYGEWEHIDDLKRVK